jgi:hypothetical protein
MAHVQQAKINNWQAADNSARSHIMAGIRKLLGGV